MKLSKIELHKYKSFVTDQSFEVDPELTCIVGKNESGKTAVLEAIAKINYFDKDDTRFVFDQKFDYPKNEWKKTPDPDETEIITLTFDLEPNEIGALHDKIGEKALKFHSFKYTRQYSGNSHFSGVNIDEEEFIKFYSDRLSLDTDQKKILKGLDSLNDFLDFLNEHFPDTEHSENISKMITDSFEWSNRLEGHVAKTFLKPNMPVFWYFDEYFTLPGRIDLSLVAGNQSNTIFTEENLKISKALLDLAHIDIKEFVAATSFESFISELEATSNVITDELFEYWKTNQHLEIRFEVEPEPQSPHRRFLNVRIRNQKHRVSLPLGNRSKGFIWFFSFLVWFSKIQADQNKKYIILLDEPGLNLHASAQADLIRYINEKLIKKYQVFYTTHSPFMIESKQLHRVRTVYDTLDTTVGSVISDSIQEKDPDTLFPLQAALGYDIAQNLYISDHNLLVEGPGDLIYFQVLNDILLEQGRVGLNDAITIVPVGGLDKVTSFISLLRGSELSIVCILDTFTDQKGKRRLDNLITQKIIEDKKVLFFDQFTSNGAKIADIEDMFTPDEYISLYNNAFNAKLSTSDLSTKQLPIVKKIADHIGKDRFNHYKPAITLMRSGYTTETFCDATLDNFENLFKEINRLFL